MMLIALTLFLNAQMTPYLVIPKTRPELRSSASSIATSVSSDLRARRTGVLDLVNAERKKRGLPALKASGSLDKSAQLYADDMVKRKFFSHESPEKTTPEDRIRATGYFVSPCASAMKDCVAKFSFGENLAKGQKTPKDVVAAWMHSKVHRENILKREFTDFGLGYAGGLWVQNFGGIAKVNK